MKTQMKINSDGFNQMMRVLEKKTGASYEKVLKGITGEVVTLAARKTGKSKAKLIKESVEASLATKFVSSAGDKIRKAKDGSLIYRANGWKGGRWIRLRRDYKLSPIGKKNPAGQTLDSKTQSRANRALGELRKLQSKILKMKKERIASSQGSFLLMLKKLRIPITSSRGLGQAIKATITKGHRRAIGAKFLKRKLFATIILRSKSISALNPNSKGFVAFKMAINGKVKEFENASKKDLKGYVKKFATRHGFTSR
jgi:hypothetical protein